MVGTPAQTPRLPFVIAAEGPRGVRLATALADGWLTLGRTADTLDEWWQVVADISTRVDDSLAKVGRASETLDRYLNLDGAPQFSLESVDSWEDAIGRAEALGFTDVIGHWPRTEGIYAGNENVLIEIASRFTH
jgi:alkanesulfonate monooxygenase SsuD/methylene tetrahydromethanopterin reductase-like flavin-dependent oxidoreductase (luciferase family)